MGSAAVILISYLQDSIENQEVGSMVKFHCDAGYMMIGHPLSTCGVTGNGQHQHQDVLRHAPILADSLGDKLQERLRYIREIMRQAVYLSQHPFFTKTLSIYTFGKARRQVNEQ